LAGTLDIEEILKIFFRACTEEIGLEYVIVALVDKAQHRVKAVAGSGVSENNIKQGIQPLDSKDIMPDIIRTGKTEIITGWDERFDQEMFEAEGHEDWVRIFTPITLRQENIGMVEAGFNRKIRATIQNILVSIQPTIQEYQVRLLQAFINQVALALDNAQRYQASQRAAHREALIKDITTKVRASTKLEDILQTTIKEISQVISSKRAYIHLVTPPGATEPAEANGKAERRAG
jgi:GAF domain-containing protein